MKNERYQKQGIAFDVEIYLLKNISISNYEMCIILGNLLENALEANESKHSGQKIVLTVKNHNEQLAVKVTNNYYKTIIDDDGHPISMKKMEALVLRVYKRWLSGMAASLSPNGTQRHLRHTC